MNLLEAWLYVKPAAWDAIAPVDGADKEIWHYAYRNAITGFWKTYTGGFEVYNIPPSSQAQIQAIIDQLSPADVAHVFAWKQGNGMVSRNVWPPGENRAAVLAVMKDLPDETPASYSEPNWGHVFLGQSRRIFSGGFSSGFSEGFR